MGVGGCLGGDGRSVGGGGGAAEEGRVGVLGGGGGGVWLLRFPIHSELT